MSNEKNTRNLSVDLRPATFEEFLGSSKLISQIRTQLDSGRIPTAFLLSGPTGCGKTTLARCISTHLGGDIIEANAADETGVDAARSLGDTAAFMPLMGNYKVIILDEAHQLTKQAQNALLKHVEDAPPTTIWIFCTTEPSKIIPTLRGRCVSFALQGLTPEQVKDLVHRGITHLGRKNDEKTEEFIATLVRENVASPRAILMATERFVGGMDPLGSIFGTQDSPEAFEIARATYKQDWENVRLRLAKATNEEAMTVRVVCVSYFKAALLKNADVSFNSSAILELTKNIPAIDAFGLSELSARLWTICTQFDRRSQV